MTVDPNGKYVLHRDVLKEQIEEVRTRVAMCKAKAARLTAELKMRTVQP